jgi:hypothetical protein
MTFLKLCAADAEWPSALMYPSVYRDLHEPTRFPVEPNDNWDAFTLICDTRAFQSVGFVLQQFLSSILQNNNNNLISQYCFIIIKYTKIYL